jgi:hypothetical protein
MFDPLNPFPDVNDGNRHWKAAGFFLGCFIAIVFAIGTAIGFLIGL